MKQISVNQLCAIFFLIIISNKLLILPTLLYEKVQGDALLVILMSCLVGVLGITLFLYIQKKHPNLTMNDFFKQTIGEIGFKIVLFIFLFFYISKMFITIIEGQEFLGTTIYSGFNTFIYIVPLFSVTSYLIFKGLNCITRTIEVSILIVIFGLLLTMFLSIPSVTLDNALPLFTHSTSDIFNTYIQTSMWFGNYFTIFAFLGDVKLKKTDNKKIWFAVILTCIIYFAFFFLFYAIFGESSVIHKYAISDISSFTPTLTSMTKIDWFAVVIYTLTLIMQIILHAYIIFYNLSKLIHIKNNVITHIVLIVIFSLAYILQPFSIEQVVNFYLYSIGLYSTILNLGFLLFILILSKILNKNLQNKGGTYGRTLENK